jgi:hypothetical protein
MTTQKTSMPSSTMVITITIVKNEKGSKTLRSGTQPSDPVLKLRFLRYSETPKLRNSETPKSDKLISPKKRSKKSINKIKFFGTESTGTHLQSGIEKRSKKSNTQTEKEGTD